MTPPPYSLSMQLQENNTKTSFLKNLFKRFFLRFYLFIHETHTHTHTEKEREAETQAEGEALI